MPHLFVCLSDTPPVRLLCMLCVRLVMGNRVAARLRPVEQMVGIVLGLVVQGADAVNPLDVAQNTSPPRNPKPRTQD